KSVHRDFQNRLGLEGPAHVQKGDAGLDVSLRAIGKTVADDPPALQFFVPVALPRCQVGVLYRCPRVARESPNRVEQYVLGFGSTAYLPEDRPSLNVTFWLVWIRPSKLFRPAERRVPVAPQHRRPRLIQQRDRIAS